MYDLEAAHNDLTEESDLAEEQASRFARSFLIPDEELNRLMNGKDDIMLVDLAAHFMVSTTVMKQKILAM
jgi:Zn-dependent peptidase ImmA (M78 family)